MATLQNKTALVTGASRGIGRAIASALAEAGAHILVHYGRSAQKAESLVSDIHSKGGRADAIRADLGTPEGGNPAGENPLRGDYADQCRTDPSVPLVNANTTLVHCPLAVR
jgi:NAD(P)-dependent dehydrogenase (short-subunit alcohol dehydrogenase family)